MLFNSYFFIFLFLPLTLIVFYKLNKYSSQAAISWLVIASLFFYGWWNPVYIGLIILSILFNFIVSELMNAQQSHHIKKLLLIAGVTFNLFLLGYFKYANFFVNNINSVFHTSMSLDEIILPLAISFFTFQQIAYLADNYQSKTNEHSFIHYCLFVTFFPQLIAGPIVHHKEMMPQFIKGISQSKISENIAIGITVFSIGLFKKVMLADQLANIADKPFDAAAAGAILTFFEAWIASFAYSFQLYFDFSGYSDMAIGIALMFGIKLPMNFNSPYKATSIIDFWKRWHITLSRFLRDYLYIPLGGNRKGSIRRYTNLLITMILGGLWHGASWNFVVWGGLHGFYLIVNHAWIAVKHSLGFRNHSENKMTTFLARFSTLLLITIAWVPFRANDLATTISVLKGMFGMHGFTWVQISSGTSNTLQTFLISIGWRFEQMLFFKGPNDLIILAAVIGLVWWLPNTQQITGICKTEVSSNIIISPKKRYWAPTTGWAIFIAATLFVSILHLDRISAFLYFQF
ncbi:MAG: MBOAT family protein [Gammaproteobacteria bacterium]|nr:MBOAT family protein [Gammaproteobacteria bacterium]